MSRITRAYYLRLLILLSVVVSCRAVPPDELPTIVPSVVQATPTAPPTPTTVTTATHDKITPTATTLADVSATATSTLAPDPLPHSLLRPAYALHAVLDYYEHTLEATQLLTVTNTSGVVWTELVLNVSSAYWPGRFELLQAMHAGAGQLGSVDVHWENTMLHMPLAPALSPGETTTVAFSFRLALPELDPAGWGPNGNAGWGVDVTQVGDWYPALVPYDAQNGGWQTWTYHPVGDPVRSSLADYELLVRSQPGVIVVGPGYLGSEGGEDRFRLQNARAIAFLASPDYVMIEDTTETPVRVYVLAAHAASGPVVMDTALQALDLFTKRYGPYPYPELIIAENGYLTAMEYSGLISLSHFAFMSYRGSPDSLLVAITAHEVSHQWFYGAVGNDQVEAPWLDESLAMLSEWLFYESYYPELTGWWWQFRVDRWEPVGPVDVTVYDYADSPTFVHNLYGRAAHFMRELRLLLGEEAFAAFLRDYYRQFQDGWATGEGFFSVVLPYTTAPELRALTDRYFQRQPAVLVP